MFVLTRPGKPLPLKTISPVLIEPSPHPAGSPQADPLAKAAPAAPDITMPSARPAQVDPPETAGSKARADIGATANNRPDKRSKPDDTPLPAARQRSLEQAKTPPSIAIASVDCSPAFEAWCLRGATSEADRNLRNAYGAAVQAGVDRATLKGIRRKWLRYRRQANKRPADLIRGYAALTVDLHRIVAQKDGDARAERRR